ncbi:hypothetical protein SLEP1_g16630 [Rubroshorea leprosula]|uniref:ANK_REP_REGION domain-containing protein n=1 Tax=Rubroshorea leprosula TaxID=152421 RepID=A0AAV5J0R0_9ROSI|nr:hypothetical protein SLEP1_g16630 [Rubroshorea leprosula]
MRKKPFYLNAFDKMPVGDDTTVVDSNTCVADANLYYFDSDDLSVYDSDMSKEEFMVIKDAFKKAIRTYSKEKDVFSNGLKMIEIVKSCSTQGHFRFVEEQCLTPLMHAANLGHAGVVKVLLEAGAPWNALSPSNPSAGDFRSPRCI